MICCCISIALACVVLFIAIVFVIRMICLSNQVISDRFFAKILDFIVKMSIILAAIHIIDKLIK